MAEQETNLVDLQNIKRLLAQQDAVSSPVLAAPLASAPGVATASVGTSAPTAASLPVPAHASAPASAPASVPTIPGSKLPIRTRAPKVPEKVVKFADPAASDPPELPTEITGLASSMPTVYFAIVMTVIGVILYYGTACKAVP